MDLEAAGRHMLLFDDDAMAAFVNSRAALVPWSADASLLIDRYDVRHLLDRVPPRPARRLVADAGGGVSQSELDHERYLDLLPSTDDNDDEALSERTKGLDASQAAYQAVPFSYGSSNLSSAGKNPDSGTDDSCYCPSFPIPESLRNNLPPTEKVHQIISRTAIFVSKHGGQSEIVLRVKQGDNPTFGFLMPNHHLHEYFRYLVDHPQLLKTDGNSSENTKEKQSDEQENEAFAASSGALSLLGSVYGSGEDEDSMLPADSKDTEPGESSTVASKTLPKVERREASKSRALGEKEVGKHVTPTAIKEKAILTKRNQSVNPIIVGAPSSKKVKDSIVATPGAMGRRQSSQAGISDAKPLVLEPPSFLKRMMEKIVEFILRNGKEFEAVLIEQDKTIGRFPFLLPSNHYHSYYLKILQEACEGHGGNKRLDQALVSKESSACDRISAEPSDGWLYDPKRKEKFKMVIGGSKKDSDQRPTPAQQCGVSTDEAAAIVLAATRGLSPANARCVLMEESGSGRAPSEDGRPSVSFSSLQGWTTVSKPASNNEASTSINAMTNQLNKQEASISDDVWIAKAIAKTAALAASREADSSEASLTKEQKLKAERLKRAKMFAAMIKSSGPRVTELVSSANATNGPVETSAGLTRSGGDSDPLCKEREGSSVPFDTEGLDRVKHEKDSEYDENKEIKSRRKYRKRSVEQDEEEDSGESRKHSRKKLCNKEEDSGESHESHRHSRKKHRSDHSTSHIRDDQKHKKRHSSSKDKESRCHNKQHISSDDEYRHRKSSRSRHSHRDNDHSGDEDREAKSDRHRTKHHSRSKRRRGTQEEEGAATLDQSETLSNLQQELKNSGVAADAQPEAITDVPNDLRAKVRAMLLETM
ncbi:uncharacterized protein [Typha latifolia]|uniref:uncharacterized protein isoform X2 n=1 Tax=Typha latifolia TaxID=4733 RepID=UPI003C2D8C0F